MQEIMWQPAEWRERATEYLDKAQVAKDFSLREQFAELAARYLDMAEKLENQVVAAAILNAKPRAR
jgi:hypothetical protein